MLSRLTCSGQPGGIRGDAPIWLAFEGGKEVELDVNGADGARDGRKEVDQRPPQYVKVAVSVFAADGHDKHREMQRPQGGIRLQGRKLECMIRRWSRRK